MVEAHDKSYPQRLRWNRAISVNPYWVLPVDDKGHENFMPVGRGVPSSDWCGKFRGLLVCKNVEWHKGGSLRGEDSTNKVVGRLQHFWCKRSSCPVCFISGWSVRGAKLITGRLNEAVKRGFGEVEHIVVSLPKSDYGLSHGVIRGNAVRVLKSRGVVGGGMIFHGFRYNRVRLWYWSPHFHVVGVIKGGYDCRNCNHERRDCRSCGGFNGREVRGFEKAGYIVKVMGKRKTVFGTAWYQLNHSTIRTNVRRPHACTWFGVCSYRKLKVKVEERKSLCPICGEGLVKLHYLGMRRIVKDRDSPMFVGCFVDNLVDGDGALNWCEAASGSYG